MYHQQASLQLYLGLLQESNKFGINPCLRQDPNVNKASLASLNKLFNKYIPLNDINVSLPQHLDHPVVKCGNPADIVCNSFGRWAKN